MNTGWDFNKSRPNRVGQKDRNWMKVNYGSTANKNAGLNSHEYHSPYMTMNDFEDFTVDAMGANIHRYGTGSNDNMFSTTNFPQVRVDVDGIIFEPGGANINPNIDRLKNLHPYCSIGLSIANIHDELWYNTTHGYNNDYSLTFPIEMENGNVSERKIIIQIVDVSEDQSQPDRYRVGFRDENGVDRFHYHMLDKECVTTPGTERVSQKNSLNAYFTNIGIVRTNSENAIYAGDLEASDKATWGNDSTEHALFPSFTSENGHNLGDTWIIPLRKTYLGGKHRPANGGVLGPSYMTHCTSNQDYFLSYPADENYPWSVANDSNEDPYSYLPVVRPSVAVSGRYKPSHPGGDYWIYVCGQYYGYEIEINSKSDTLQNIYSNDYTERLERDQPYRNAAAVFNALPDGSCPSLFSNGVEAANMSYWDGKYRPNTGVYGHIMSGGRLNPFPSESFDSSHDSFYLNCPPGFKGNICKGRPDYYEAHFAHNPNALTNIPGEDGIIPDDEVRCSFPSSMIVGALDSPFVTGQASASHRTMSGGLAQHNTNSRKNVNAEGQLLGFDFHRKALDFEKTFKIPEGATNVTSKMVFSSFDNVLLFLDRAGTVSLPSIETNSVAAGFHYTCTLSDVKSMDAVMIGSTWRMEGNTDYLVNPANIFKDDSDRVIGINYPDADNSIIDPYMGTSNPTFWDINQGHPNNLRFRSKHSIAHWSGGGFATLNMTDMIDTHWSKAKFHVVSNGYVDPETGAVIASEPSIFDEYGYIDYTRKVTNDPFLGGNQRKDYKSVGYDINVIHDTILGKPVNQALQAAGIGALSQNKHFMAVEIKAGGKFQVYIDGYYNSNGTPKFVYYSGAITDWGDPGTYKLRARATQQTGDVRTEANATKWGKRDMRDLHKTSHGCGFVLKGYVEYDCTNARGEIAKINGEPLYYSKQEALDRAKVLGCNGYHTHKYEGITGYMACQSHAEATK
tara:strand:+ start:26 stop:2908 length:2883 start_codon:yes stop_codon:yes gene_type:complete